MAKACLMASFRDADAIVGTGMRGYGTDEVDMRREKGSQTRHMNVHGYLTGMVVVQAQGAAHCSILWKLDTYRRLDQVPAKPQCVIVANCLFGISSRPLQAENLTMSLSS